MALQKEQAAEMWIFLLADSVLAAMADQKTPDRFYNVERMRKAVIAKSGRVKFCGSCADARGLTDAMLLFGVERGSMAELASWVAESDKSLVF